MPDRPPPAETRAWRRRRSKEAAYEAAEADAFQALIAVLHEGQVKQLQQIIDVLLDKLSP